MLGETCSCLLCVLVPLVVVFLGLALFHYPTRKKQKELEYMLRQAQENWKGEKHAEEEKTWDEATPN